MNLIYNIEERFVITCDSIAGFNFLKTCKSIIGYVNSLEIGGEVLTENINAKNPTDFETNSVVGIINYYGWEGGLTQPQYFDMQVTTSNKTLVDTLITNKLDSTKVVIGFTIYEYDPEAKKYFVSRKGEELEGNLYEINGNLALHVEAEANTEVQMPRNYKLELAVVPEQKDQDILIATSREMKFVRDWGVAVNN